MALVGGIGVEILHFYNIFQVEEEEEPKEGEEIPEVRVVAKMLIMSYSFHF